MLLGFAFVDSAQALDPGRSLFQYNCQTWRRANGLPANGINAIAQTRDGRLWLGTSKGLVCFDGVEFSVARQPNGFRDLIITSLAPRSTGGLCYGLERGGFGTFDGKQFHPAERLEWTQPSVSMHAMAEGRDGTILLAGNALAGRLTDPNTLHSLLPTTSADVFSLCEDGRGRIWMGTAEHGLFYWLNGRLVSFPDKTLRNGVIS